MDSDDEDMSSVVLPGAPQHGLRIRNNSVFQMAIGVYDIRGKDGIVQSKTEYIHVDMDPITGIPKNYKMGLAERHGLSEEFVYFHPRKNLAVIHDNTDLLIILIDFQRSLEVSSMPYSLSRFSAGCIGLAPATSIGTLKSVIHKNEHFNKGKFPCLFLKGKRCDEDSSTVGSLFKIGDVVACIAKSNVTVHCFHMPRLNVEYKYTLSCFNTDNICEMKRAFKKSFCTEFPGLASGVDDVWFSVGKQLVKDEEYFFIDQQRRMQMPERGRLVVHVKQTSSFPIILRMNSQEHTSQILLMSAPFTTAELRQEVSHLTGQPPSALRLYTKNKKLKEMVLSKAVGIGPNCVVLAKVSKKIRVLVTLHCEGSTKRIAVQLFKLDSVQRLKEILQEYGLAAVSQLQMFFNTTEMENERLMQYYRIRDDDNIAACVLSKPEYILVRQPGRECLHLTVDGLQYTIRRLKKYLASTLGCCYVMINMIHGGRCLQDDETLEQCGLVSGSTILIPRLAMQEQPANEGILKVYMSQEDGSFQIAFAKEAAGILFYAPDSIPCARFEKHTTKSVAPDEDYRRGIILRRLSQEIKLEPCNPKPLHHNEVVHHSTQHGSGPSTSRSDSLAQGLSLCNVHNQRRDPQRLVHTQPGSLGYYSDPESLPSKRYMYFKELTEKHGRLIIREESVLDVSKSNAVEGFPHIVETPSVQSPEKVMSSSTEHELHRSPSLQFPVGAIQTSVLQAVSRELGNDWKQVALALGLETSDIDNVVYRHNLSLHEQALQALILWKRRNSINATVANLKKTLRDCNLALIADSIDENIKYESV